eukprot:scaffold112670_cov75-Phaeocystis_antarctica.AAC.1
MVGRGKGKGPKRVVGHLRERLVVALDNAALDVVVGDPVLVGHRSDLGEHHWRLFRIQAGSRCACLLEPEHELHVSMWHLVVAREQQKVVPLAVVVVKAERDALQRR